MAKKDWKVINSKKYTATIYEQNLWKSDAIMDKWGKVTCKRCLRMKNKEKDRIRSKECNIPEPEQSTADKGGE